MEELAKGETVVKKPTWVLSEHGWSTRIGLKWPGCLPVALLFLCNNHVLIFFTPPDLRAEP